MFHSCSQCECLTKKKSKPQLKFCACVHTINWWQLKLIFCFRSAKYDEVVKEFFFLKRKMHFSHFTTISSLSLRKLFYLPWLSWKIYCVKILLLLFPALKFWFVLNILRWILTTFHQHFDKNCKFSLYFGNLNLYFLCISSSTILLSLKHPSIFRNLAIRKLFFDRSKKNCKISFATIFLLTFMCIKCNLHINLYTHMKRFLYVRKVIAIKKSNKIIICIKKVIFGKMIMRI